MLMVGCTTHTLLLLSISTRKKGGSGKNMIVKTRFNFPYPVKKRKEKATLCNSLRMHVTQRRKACLEHCIHSALFNEKWTL